MADELRSVREVAVWTNGQWQKPDRWPGTLSSRIEKKSLSETELRRSEGKGYNQNQRYKWTVPSVAQLQAGEQSEQTNRQKRISHTVKTCMQIIGRESTHDAPFSSLPSRNGSCLSRQDILGLELSWRHRSGCGIMPDLRRDGVRARTQYVSPTIVPSKSHRYDFPQVEFKRKTPFLATHRDFCLSGLRRVIVCWVLQIPSRRRRWPTVSLWSVNRDWFTELYWPSNGVSLQKRRPSLIKLLRCTDDRPSIRNLLFSFRYFGIFGILFALKPL